MFKKFALVLLILAVFAGSAWAGLATVTRTEYGYSITGGVSNTTIIADTWVTSTAYVVGDRVIYSGAIYVCQIAHTSGTFATDLSASDWVFYQYATLWVTGISQYASTTTDLATIMTGQSTGVSSGTSAYSILNTTSTNFTDPNGVQLTNPRIQLKAATDQVSIFVKRQNF
jgi:hypothetical protein